LNNAQVIFTINSVVFYMSKTNFTFEKRPVAGAGDGEETIG